MNYIVFCYVINSITSTILLVRYIIEINLDKESVPYVFHWYNCVDKKQAKKEIINLYVMSICLSLLGWIVSTLWILCLLVEYIIVKMNTFVYSVVDNIGLEDKNEVERLKQEIISLRKGITTNVR